MKKPNETAQLKVLRDGEEHEFSVTLQPVSHGSIYLMIFENYHLSLLDANCPLT